MQREISPVPSPATAPDLRLRAMAAGDLEAAYRLSRSEKWPHRLQDWEHMLAMGAGIVAERDGQIVGTIMLWCYDAHSATLGMVIVSSECRGMGVGRKLMQAALDRAGTRAVRLNATEDGLALYESLGFKPVGAILQHQGTAVSVPVVAPGPGERIRPMGSADVKAIIALDAAATGMTRTALMTDLVGTAGCVVLDRDGEAAGFAVFRRFGHGYSVGPVTALDAQGAKALMAYWLGLNSGTFVRLDVSEASGLSPWLNVNGMANVSRVVTMVKGEWPDIAAPQNSFAIVSQALG